MEQFLIACLQGYGVSVGLENAGNLVIEPGMSFRIITTISLVAGTTFLMWLGEQITLRGVGNGISLIIFSGIVAEIPRALASTFELRKNWRFISFNDCRNIYFSYTNGFIYSIF